MVLDYYVAATGVLEAWKYRIVCSISSCTALLHTC